MPTRPFHDSYLLEYSAEHVYYEFWMFFEMVKRLNALPVHVVHSGPTATNTPMFATTTSTSAVTPVATAGQANSIAPPSRGASSSTTLSTAGQNALIESFMAHLRNIIEFLFTDNPRTTDVVAADFFMTPDDWHKIRPSQSNTLKDARTRTDKELAT